MRNGNLMQKQVLWLPGITCDRFSARVKFCIPCNSGTMSVISFSIYALQCSFHERCIYFLEVYVWWLLIFVIFSVRFERRLNISHFLKMNKLTNKQEIIKPVTFHKRVYFKIWPWCVLLGFPMLHHCSVTLHCITMTHHQGLVFIFLSVWCRFLLTPALRNRRSIGLMAVKLGW